MTPVFTVDWFSQNIPALTEVLAKFKGQPDIHALEIGCFEGKGTLWMLDNILSDPTCTITCIDTFKGSQEHNHFGMGFDGVFERYMENVGRDYSKVMTLKGSSAIQISEMPKDVAYSIVYVDGSHMAPDVLTDMVLSWPLLKKGGVMFCDDYEWPGTDGIEIHRPKVAIDAFLRIFAEQLKVIHQGYSVAVEKL